MNPSVPAKGKDRFRLPRWGQRGTAGASIPAQLTFENIVMTYGETDVLDHVSLTIDPGEVVCLLGHSGCGKTTLLRIAAGVETPSSGRVLIDGQQASGPGGFVEPERRGIGLMFQDYALFPHMSVQQNVMFGLSGLSANEAAIAALRALSRVGLERYADEYPHTLSGGEQQRVALARSIAPRPGVLLMDEPFSNLDKRMRDAVRDETVAILRETRRHHHRGDARSRGGDANRGPYRADAELAGSSSRVRPRNSIPRPPICSRRASSVISTKSRGRSGTAGSRVPSACFRPPASRTAPPSSAFARRA